MTGHDRLHALDAVRGFALLAGVVLHAAMSFLPGFSLVLPIFDNSPSVFLGVVFFVIHMFRMSLFFFIAGFFGRMLLEREGVKGFLVNRAVRILLPLIAFWIVVFPAIVATVIWGAYKVYGPNLPPPPAPPANGPWLPFPLTHLWFMYVLLLLYGAMLLVRLVFDKVIDSGGALRRHVDTALRVLLTGPFAVFVLAAPLAVCLSLMNDWPAWFGVPTPDQSLIPNLAATIAFTTAFSLGWLVHRQPQVLKIWEQRWWLHLALAVALTAGCLGIAGVQPLYGFLTIDWQRALFATCYCLGIWNWCFAILGIALRFCSAVSPVRRYVADASYWVYLLHLPLVFLLQVAVQDAPWHWTVKFPLILSITLAVLFVSYHLLVRSTYLGLWLNGRRYPWRAIEHPPSPQVQAVSEPSAAGS